MVFNYQIRVPANTLKESPYKKTLPLTKGVIQQLDIFFPPGCSNMVDVAFNRGLHQVYPTNPDGVFTGDGSNITGKDFYYVKNVPYQLEIFAWSPGTSYDHIISVRLWMLHVWQMLPNSDELYKLAFVDSREVEE